MEKSAYKLYFEMCAVLSCSQRLDKMLTCRKSLQIRILSCRKSLQIRCQEKV